MSCCDFHMLKDESAAVRGDCGGHFMGVGGGDLACTEVT